MRKEKYSVMAILLVMLMQFASAELVINGNSVDKPLEISYDGAYDGAVIEGPSGTYRLLGDNKEISFIPKEAGIYNIKLVNNGEEIISKEVIVETNIQLLKLGDRIPLIDGYDVEIVVGEDIYKTYNTSNSSFTTKDSELHTIRYYQGDKFSFEEKYYVEPKEVIEVRTQTEDGRLIVNTKNEIPKIKASIGKINVNNEELDAIRIFELEGNYDNADLEIVAKGEEIFVCDEFETECLTGWRLYKQTSVGEVLTLNFKNNTAYAEIGLATINSIKPIYVVGETAEFLTAVLDIGGYLVSNASLTVQVVNPNGELFDISPSVEERSAGIYYSSFQNTLIEGYYTITVIATGDMVDNRMSSVFLVQNNYEFDILRNSPSSIDPFAGSHNTSFNILPKNTNKTGAIVRESVPDTFEIISTSSIYPDGSLGPAASIIIAGNRKILSWPEMPLNSTYSYESQAPAISPELYYLGPIFADQFEEARQWALAADPTLHDDSLSANESSVWQGNQLTLTAAISCTGGGQAINFNLWPEDDGAEIINDNTCTGRDFEWVSTVVNSCIGSDSCTASATTARVDFVKCKNGATASVTWTLKACGTNEALPSSNTIALGSNIADSFDLTTSVTITQVPDTQAPNVSIGDPQNDTFTSDNTPTFYYTPVDNRGFASCTLVLNDVLNASNSTGIINGSLNSITPTLSDGNYLWTVNCTDTSGNSAIDEGLNNITIDTTDPSSISLVSPENQSYLSDLTPLFEWTQTSENNFDNYTLLIDTDTSFSPAEQVIEITSISTLTHTLVSTLSNLQKYYWKIRIYDLAGNTYDTGIYEFTTDTTPPTAFSLVSPSNGAISTDTTPLFDWGTVTETYFSNYTLQVDTNSDFSTASEYYETTRTTSQYQIVTPLAPNLVYYWRVIAYDLAGNTRYSSQNFTYETDNTPPSTNIQYPVTSSYYSSATQNLNYTVSDTNLDACWYTINGGAKNNLASCLNTSIVYSAGVKTLRVYANDSAGNQNFSLVTFTIDLTNPTVSLSYPGNGNFQTSKPFNLNYTPTDTNLDTCTLYTNATGAWTANGSSSASSGIVNSFSRTYPDGYYTWNVICTDLAGRTGTAGSNRTFKLDTTPPTINLMSPEEAHTEITTNNIQFYYNVSDITSSINKCELYIDGLYDQQTLSPQENTQLSFIQNLNNGAHNWSVRCTDAAGLLKISEVRNITVSVTNDNDPPILMLNYPSEGDYVPSQNVEFNYTASDSTGIENCSVFLDGSLNATNSSILLGGYNYFTITSISEGAHDYSIECYDNSTNSNYVMSETINFTVDITFPDLFLYSPESIIYNTTKNLDLNYSTFDTNALTCYYDINGQGNNSISGCNNVSFNALRGINNFTLYSEDLAGNTNSSYIQFTAWTNSSIGSFFSTQPSTETAPHTLYVNYSDEFGNPVSDAVCSGTDSIDIRLKQIGYLEEDALYNDNAIYGSNILRVDFTNIPDADAYDIYFYAYRQASTIADLDVYLRCDGLYTTAPQYLVGSVQKSEALAYPEIGKHKIQVNKSDITTENCSVIFESAGSGLSQNWSLTDIDGSFPDYSYYSINDGASYNTIPNVFVDIGAEYSSINLSFNASSGYYELQNLHHDIGGEYWVNLSCSAPYSFERNDTILDNVSISDLPKLQIISISPSPVTYLVEGLSVDWAANSFGLGTNYLNLSYPNGSLLAQNFSKPFVIDTNSLDVPGNYSVLIYAEHASDGDFNTSTQTFEVIDYAPRYYNISNSPSSPQVYNSTLIYYFNSTWLDQNNNLKAVYLENNFFGTLKNSSVTNSSNVFFYQAILPAGSFNYRWVGVDSNNNTNLSSYQNFVVNKDNGTLNLTLDGISANKTINESQILNISSRLLKPTAGIVYVYQNGSLLGSGSTPYTILKNFTTPGSYNITSRYLGNQNFSSARKEFTLTVNDVIAPKISLISPDELEIDLDGTVNFEFSVQDTGSLNNCSLYINSTVNDTKTGPAKDTVLTFSKDFVNGAYDWYVGCYDKANNYGISEIRNFSVDIRTFIIDVLPISCVDGGTCDISLINSSNQNYDGHGNLANGNNYVYVNLTSANISLGSTIDYLNVTWEKFQETSLGSLDISWWDGDSWQSICTEIFVSSTAISPNDIECAFGTYPSVSQLNAGLQLRGNFFYSAGSGGKAYETDFVGLNLQYTEDTTPPTVTLNSPDNNQQLGAGNITFYYTPLDDNLDNCTLFGNFNGSFVSNETDFTPLNNQMNNFTVYLEPGYYTWNVECVDIAENYAFSASNRTVNVTKPDLQILGNNINFSNINPVEFDFVNVSAYITNEGLTAAENFSVEFFYGNPDIDGIQFGNTQIISNLPGSQGVYVNETYQTKAGPNNIYVRLDFNNTVDESSESNNLAFNTLDVSAYAIYYGNITKDIILVSSSNDALIRFYNITNNTGNVFIADYDDSISFGSLLALGKNINELPTANDFDDADILLGTDSFDDSISNVWASGTNNPDQTISVEAYGLVINDVPIINNSESSGFITGILWDSSYDVADLQYSQDDKEPLVFYTTIDSNTQGIYGVYDMEVKVPALLRNYSAGNDLVTFYIEIE